MERIIDTVEHLARFPELGRIVPEAGVKEIREILFSSYRIMYRLEPDGILILAVIHGAQDLAGRTIKPWEVG